MGACNLAVFLIDQHMSVAAGHRLASRQILIANNEEPYMEDISLECVPQAHKLVSPQEVDNHPVDRMERLRESMADIPIWKKIAACGIAVAAVYPAVQIRDIWDAQHHVVNNRVVSLPATEIPTLPVSVASPNFTTNHAAGMGHITVKHEVIKPLPELSPLPPTRLQVPKLGIDTSILPVDSQPTDLKNAFGGTIFRQIDFPVDNSARYWTRQGQPNTLPVSYDQNPTAALRTEILGHASDIRGNHLLFQDLQLLQLNDTFTITAGKYNFTYTVYSLSNPDKAGLANDQALYGIPPNGRKEAALVACLPNTASHSVRIGYLSSVNEVGAPAVDSSNIQTSSPAN